MTMSTQVGCEGTGVLREAFGLEMRGLRSPAICSADALHAVAWATSKANTATLMARTRQATNAAPLTSGSWKLWSITLHGRAVSPFVKTAGLLDLVGCGAEATIMDNLYHLVAGEILLGSPAAIEPQFDQTQQIRSR